MTRSQSAHRPEFTVRCACGIEYHTSDEHIGKWLPCRCGRTVEIIRPPDAPAAKAGDALRNEVRSASRSESRSSSRRHSARPGELFSAPREKVREKKSRSKRSRSSREHGVRRTRQRGLWRAMSVWLASTIRPVFFGRPVVRIAASLAWIYLLGITLAWIALAFTSDRALPGTVITYGPRFVALYPLALLIPLSAFVVRATLWPLTLALCIALGPVMGGRVSLRTLFSAGLPDVPAKGTFRLLTFNAEGGGRLAYDLAVLLREQHPDIVTFQECDDKLWSSLQAQEGWYTERYGSLCTGSRWPIGQVDMMPREDLARISKLGFGGTGLVMRTYLDTPNGPLVLVNLHLETARKGLEGMLGEEGFIPNDPFGATNASIVEEPKSTRSNLERFEINATIRTAESQRASHYASQGIARSPIVVAGDFNLPVESTIFRRFWSGFTDAFEARGNGLGWSKREGRWLRIRIDHVLTNDAGPRPVGIALGPDYSSDHLPVIVDLAWPSRSSR